MNNNQYELIKTKSMFLFDKLQLVNHLIEMEELDLYLKMLHRMKTNYEKKLDAAQDIIDKKESN